MAMVFGHTLQAGLKWCIQSGGWPEGWKQGIWRWTAEHADRSKLLVEHSRTMMVVLMAVWEVLESPFLHQHPHFISNGVAYLVMHHLTNYFLSWLFLHRCWNWSTIPLPWTRICRSYLWQKSMIAQKLL